MSKIIFISSGKGGAGKSSVCALLGKALSDMGKSVLIVELDFGLRGQDVLNGVCDEVLFDIEDVFKERCDVSKAIIKSALSENLFLLPTTNNMEFSVDLASLKNLLTSLKESYDYLLLDSPAGITGSFRLGGELADISLIVTEPSLVSVRDSARCAKALSTIGKTKLRLIINKSPKFFKPSKAIPDYDAIIDMTMVQLIGVIPEDEKVKSLLGEGKMLGLDSRAFMAAKNIAKRLQGEFVDLLIK